MTIEVEHLSKRFTSGRRARRKLVDAVHDLSFAVEAGERVAYIGPNGAGKSTSIKVLTGILEPTGGQAHVLGLVPWRQRRALSRRIGTLFGQRSLLWSELTTDQSLRMLAAIYGIADPVFGRRRAELGELLDATELFDQPVRTLSLGQRMRFELVACMLHQPEILFLDEPTIGLDLLGKQRFRELVVRLNEEQGTTIFLTSHDVADIESVARRVLVINHGALIYDDTVEAMRRSFFATKLIEVGLDHPVGPVECHGADVVEQSDQRLRLVVDTTVRPVRAVVDDLLDRLPVGDLSIVDPPLDAVIAEIYATGRPR